MTQPLADAAAPDWVPFTPADPDWEDQWQAFSVALGAHPDGAASTITDYMAMDRTCEGVRFKHIMTRKSLRLDAAGVLS